MTISQNNQDMIDRLEDRELQIFLLLIECYKTFCTKNRQYEDGIRATGVLGASVELVSAARRLRPMVLNAEGHGRPYASELRHNILPDIIVYGLIVLAMLEDNNWEGIEDEEDYNALPEQGLSGREELGGQE